MSNCYEFTAPKSALSFLERLKRNLSNMQDEALE